MILETKISPRHAPLLKIFFEANNFDDTEISLYNEPWKQGSCHGKTAMRIEIKGDNSELLLIMAIKHGGVENMLYDYLIKCGVVHIEY